MNARRGKLRASRDLRKMDFMPHPLACKRGRFVERCGERISLSPSGFRRLQELSDRDGCDPLDLNKLHEMRFVPQQPNGCCGAA
jgi:hypothetical protein